MPARWSLRTQLGIIFVCFLLLVVGSVTATFLAARAQADDARVINLAGRQRMLTQKITWLALNQPDNPELPASIQLFEQSLRALRDGGTTLDSKGQAVHLPPAPDAALRAHLDDMALRWASFRSHLYPLEPEVISLESPHLLADLDRVVSEFEDRAEAKLARLQIIQLVFVVAALILLAGGYWTTRQRILQPLAALQAATRRISEGNLRDPMQPLGDDELGDLSRALEQMRSEVAASHGPLEERVNRRTHELASAFEFSQEIVAQLDLEHLLHSVAARTCELAHAEASALCLLDDAKAALLLTECSGNQARAEGQRQAIDCEPAREVVGAGQTVVTRTSCAQCVFLLAQPRAVCAVAPLQTGGKMLGALCVTRSENEPFDPDETRALTLLANSAAIAIANARLAEADRRQAEQAAALTERERLAAELHDHLAQTLSLLNLKTDRAQHMLAAGHVADAVSTLDHIKSATRSLLGNVRAALVGLQDPAPTADELAQRLAACVDGFRLTTGVTAVLSLADSRVPALPPILQTQAVQIVREALTNVVRHAQAQHVRVRVEQCESQACFIVEDDGCGFDPAGVEGTQHLGLTIMQARAEKSGGRLTVDSAPNAGTRVTLALPLSMPHPAKQTEILAP